jgi:hypothetical protein
VLASLAETLEADDWRGLAERLLARLHQLFPTQTYVNLMADNERVGESMAEYMYMQPGDARGHCHGDAIHQGFDAVLGFFVPQIAPERADDANALAVANMSSSELNQLLAERSAAFSRMMNTALAGAARKFSDEHTFVVRVQPAFTRLKFGYEDVEHTLCTHPALNLTEGMARTVYQNMLHPPGEQMVDPREMVGESWEHDADRDGWYL